MNAKTINFSRVGIPDKYSSHYGSQSSLLEEMNITAKSLAKALKPYAKNARFIWCQEEPLNQGAWFSHRHRIQRVLDRLGDGLEVSLVSRPAAAAPAVGLMKLHLQQQKDLVNEAIGK
mgnify:CR=1 FL=1